MSHTHTHTYTHTHTHTDTPVSPQIRNNSVMEVHEGPQGEDGGKEEVGKIERAVEELCVCVCVCVCMRV
jgi:hypothetical protein